MLILHVFPGKRACAKGKAFESKECMVNALVKNIVENIVRLVAEARLRLTSTPRAQTDRGSKLQISQRLKGWSAAGEAVLSLND